MESSDKDFDRRFTQTSYHVPMSENHGRHVYRSLPLPQNPFSDESYSYRTLETSFSGLSLSDYDSAINGFEGEIEQSGAALQTMCVFNNGGFNQRYDALESYGHFSIANHNGGFRLDTVSTNLNGLRSCLTEHHFDQMSLRVFQGRIVSLAKNQHGCRFLNIMFEDIKEDELEMIFMEVIEHIGELMVDQFGNHLIQKLVEVCNTEMRTQILLSITITQFQLVSICLNIHGTRCVQKLMEYLITPHQISLLTSALAPGAVMLMKDLNGYHVIKECLRRFSDEYNMYILSEVAANCFKIATDKRGCCVLPPCVDHSRGQPRERLLSAIIANAPLLSQDRYGNYVVQHLLGLKIAQVTANLLGNLEGNYLALSCNKYGSNVVQKCLINADEEQLRWIVMELLQSPNVSMLLLDAFGNYVFQSALAVSKGFVHDALVKLVEIHSASMRTNLYGKKVLTWLDKNKVGNTHGYRR